MTEEITLEEALELVSFYHEPDLGWGVRSVDGDIKGNVHGNIKGAVFGSIGSTIYGAVGGDVEGDVSGTINGLMWKHVETPRAKLQRLITASGSQELIDAFNQMESN